MVLERGAISKQADAPGSNGAITTRFVLGLWAEVGYHLQGIRGGQPHVGTSGRWNTTAYQGPVDFLRPVEMGSAAVPASVRRCQPGTGSQPEEGHYTIVVQPSWYKRSAGGRDARLAWRAFIRWSATCGI